MTQGTFRMSLRSFERRFDQKVDRLVRAVALDVTKAIVLRTPVDTGRARGNWQVTLGTPSSETGTKLDPAGAMAQAKALTALAGYTPGASVFIVNNLPYIVRLEYGSSAQAPGGMVRITAREWRAKVARVAQGMAR